MAFIYDSNLELWVHGPSNTSKLSEIVDAQDSAISPIMGWNKYYYRITWFATNGPVFVFSFLVYRPIRKLILYPDIELSVVEENPARFVPSMSRSNSGKNKLSGCKCWLIIGHYQSYLSPDQTYSRDNQFLIVLLSSLVNTHYEAHHKQVSQSQLDFHGFLWRTESNNE